MISRAAVPYLSLGGYRRNSAGFVDEFLKWERI